MTVDNRYLTTREVAELLRIKERKVYDMAAEQQIPCTRATGKLLFSSKSIEQWLAAHSTGSEVSDQRPVLFAGSHDPLLEWAVRESQCNIPTMFDGSVDGLQRVMAGEASVVALHIYAATDNDWNLPAVTQYDSESVVLVKWVARQRGLMFSNKTKLTCFEDIKNFTVVSRQAGAGSQLLLEHLLQRSSLTLADLNTVTTARSEADVAQAIAQGDADCGLGIESLAKLHNLQFLPLIEEPLDLLIDRRFWFEPSMQKFISFCRGSVFSDKLNDMPGYSASQLFSVRYNG